MAMICRVTADDEINNDCPMTATALASLSSSLLIALYVLFWFNFKGCLKVSTWSAVCLVSIGQSKRMSLTFLERSQPISLSITSIRSSSVIFGLSRRAWAWNVVYRFGSRCVISFTCCSRPCLCVVRCWKSLQDDSVREESRSWNVACVELDADEEHAVSARLLNSIVWWLLVLHSVSPGESEVFGRPKYGKASCSNSSDLQATFS